MKDRESDYFVQDEVQDGTCNFQARPRFPALQVAPSRPSACTVRGISATGLLRTAPLCMMGVMLAG